MKLSSAVGVRVGLLVDVGLGVAVSVLEGIAVAVGVLVGVEVLVGGGGDGVPGQTLSSQRMKSIRV